ncbi:MAG: permease-like cell division protein FtsX [Paludibacteraceae bacterium]|jgi:cell division transport system permease protein|nr:permease-like cell division protein FtsX [Paludibacteraceae bacterium]MDO4525402.1 permease-like cell division protein FtsX [Bacteroidales bacterium]MBQ6561593.1 permease-like cell division protein FtsX [Paludibacteraceae bacterium]MBQ8018987.1 permease-like cell division protein FtsX [Paludibacteraceae bacterium]MBR6110912.1 permease-like cell division protein FtsX [Paludibacteraceae bacterium]
MKDSIAKYKIFNSKLTTIVSISMVLFLIGIVVLGLKIGDTLSAYVRENYTISIEIKDDAADKEISTLDEILRGQSYSKKVVFISKEQAIKDLSQEMGEDPVAFLGYNPLSASFVVNLKSEYTDNDKIESVVKSIKEYRIVENVDYQKQFISEVNHNIQKVSLLFLIVAAVLFFISFVLINNTLRLLIYSDRFLINTMKLVGATRSFIRRPYLKKGVVIGLIAALLAIGYFALFGYLMRDQLRLFVDYSDYSTYYVVAGAIIVSGIVISWLSTYFAVNKFLSREEKELYYI